MDDALQMLSAEQSKISALFSRLDYRSASTLAESAIVDEAKTSLESADIALEIAEFTRLQILKNAEVAVLAQANLQMQLVLNLLKDL